MKHLSIYYVVMENFEDITKEIYEEEERRRKKLLEQMRRQKELRKKQLARGKQEIEEKTTEILDQTTEIKPEEIKEPEVLDMGDSGHFEISPDRKAQIEREIEQIEQEIDEEVALSEEDLEPITEVTEELFSDNQPIEVEISELETKIEQQVDELQQDNEVEEGVLDENMKILNGKNEVEDERGEQVESLSVDKSEDLKIERVNLENPEQDLQIVEAKNKVQKRESGNDEPRMTPGKASELLEVARSEQEPPDNREKRKENRETDSHIEDEVPTFLDLLTKPATNEKLYAEDEVTDEPTVEEIMRERFTANGTPKEDQKSKGKNQNLELIEQEENEKNIDTKEKSERMPVGKKQLEDRDKIKESQIVSKSEEKEDQSAGGRYEKNEKSSAEDNDERVEQLDKGTQEKIKSEKTKVKNEDINSKEKSGNSTQNETASEANISKASESKQESIKNKKVPDLIGNNEKSNSSAASRGEMPKDYLTKEDLIKEFEKRDKKEDGSVQEFGIVYWFLLYIPIFIVVFSIILCVVFKQETFICRFFEAVWDSLMGIFGF